MFVDLDWPLNVSSLLSASAELLVIFSATVYTRHSVNIWKWKYLELRLPRLRQSNTDCSRGWIQLIAGRTIFFWRREFEGERGKLKFWPRGGSAGPASWNTLPTNVRDFSLSIRELRSAENTVVCRFGFVAARAFVTIFVNCAFWNVCYYYYYYYYYYY